jgi:hypothetical protein
MPTPDQIEAVARAIAQYDFDFMPLEAAQAAIAAYEATRPSVCEVTDDLISAIIEAAKPNPKYAYTMGTPRERVRAVLEAAYWIAPAGAATEGE